MKSFNTFLEESEIHTSVCNLMELSMLSEIQDVKMLQEEVKSLNEALDIKGALESAGLHVKKGRGLIQIIASAGKRIGQIFYHALKAYAGNEESKLKLKELLSRKVTKEEIIDVLLKLDTLTLHALTGPIHMIDALTGWHIGPNLHKVANVKKDLKVKLDQAIALLKDASKVVSDKIKKRIEKTLNTIKNLFKQHAPQEQLT